MRAVSRPHCSASRPLCHIVGCACARHARAHAAARRNRSPPCSRRCPPTHSRACPSPATPGAFVCAANPTNLAYFPECPDVITPGTIPLQVRLLPNPPRPRLAASLAQRLPQMCLPPAPAAAVLSVCAHQGGGRDRELGGQRPLWPLGAVPARRVHQRCQPEGRAACRPGVSMQESRGQLSEVGSQQALAARLAGPRVWLFCGARLHCTAALPLSGRGDSVGATGALFRCGNGIALAVGAAQGQPLLVNLLPAGCARVPDAKGRHSLSCRAATTSMRGRWRAGWGARLAT